jgi:hypothetical protein
MKIDGTQTTHLRSKQIPASGPDGYAALRIVVGWHYSKTRFAPESQPSTPFYCDYAQVGEFAVCREELAAGTDSAVFRLFITLAMYQALRDVVIMRRQRERSRAAMSVVADLDVVRRAVTSHPCEVLRSNEAFEKACDVFKVGGTVDCGRHPEASCHVKDATLVFNRMGDMGKLPTSAYLRIWRDRDARSLLAEVCRENSSPTTRASLLVERFAKVHRVGRKLATMFVSSLSTPALAPGPTPWCPEVDGNELVVVDTNVARAVDALAGPTLPRTYAARERWVREQAAQIDLGDFRRDLPKYSPRLVQEALYAFCSKSNRTAQGDPCIGRPQPCSSCASALCPFGSVRDSGGALASS